MHLYDCCPISDGAVCILLVGEELARNFTDAPLHVAGLGQGSGRGLHAAADLTSFEPRATPPKKPTPWPASDPVTFNAPRCTTVFP